MADAVVTAFAVLLKLLFTAAFIFKFKGTRPLWAACFAAVLLALLSLAHESDKKPQDAIAAGALCDITAVVSEAPEYLSENSYRVLLKVKAGESEEGERFQGSGMVIYTSFEPDFEIGDTLSFKAFVKESKLTHKYGSGSGYPIYASIAKSGEVLAEKPSSRSFYFYAAGARRWLSLRLSELAPDTAAIAKGILLGDKSGFTEDMSRAFRLSGMTHALVVSGMHINFLIVALAVLFSRLGINKKFALGATALCILPFCAVIGFAPSVVRAGIMGAVICFSGMFRKRSISVHSLVTAVALILLFAPYSAASLGLWLSVFATLGLLLFSQPLAEAIAKFLEKLHIRGAAKAFISESLGLSISATGMISPLLILAFGELQILSPISMLLSYFAVTGVFVLAIIYCALSLLGPLAVIIGFVMDMLCDYMVFVLDAISRVPFVSLPARFGFLPVAAAALAILLIFYKRAKKRDARVKAAVPALAVLSALLIVTVSILTYKPFAALLYPEKYMLLSVVDVAQGDCIVLQNGRKAVIIDAGGSGTGSAVADRIEGYLKSRGVSHIEAVILSHYHSDHANALPSLLSRYNIGAVYMPDVFENDLVRVEIEAAARVRGTQVVLLSENMVLEPVGGMVLDIFTEHMDFEEDGGKNEQCLVIRADFKGSSVLVTGDIDEDAELSLVSAGAPIQSDVLKVAHHGSKSSSSEFFLSVVKPAAAVISAGAGNSYGHPAQDALLRISSYTGVILRTDIEGTLELLARDGGFEILG